MALNLRSLVNYVSVPHTADAPPVNFYKYASADTMAAIIAAGYFNNARDVLKVNDVIEFVGVATGTGNYGRVVVTAAPASGNVTTAVDDDLL